MQIYNHVLVAIDFSTAADQVLSKALDIAQGNNAKLSLLHVVEYTPPMDYIYDSVLDVDWASQEKMIVEHAREKMQKFAKKHALDNVALDVESGAPKLMISQFVKQHKCDLVVLGSHGRHGINLLLGSTANAVLHAMPCDVLTIKIEK